MRRGGEPGPEGPRSSQRRSPTRAALAALRDTGLTSAVALVRDPAHPLTQAAATSGAVVVSGFDLLPSVIIMCGKQS